MNRLDHHSATVAPEEILGFACVRNEALRLPHFLDYHRQLGVDRFFVVDNDSSDGTTQFLLAQRDVHVFHTAASYAASNCGVAWLNELLGRFGAGHWTLTLDADELLIYPDCEGADLHRLVSALDRTGASGLPVFLLDMYSERPIAETRYTAGTPFLDLCRYFDSDTYHERDKTGLPVRGGARHRLFWAGRNRAKPSPVLKKIPLVRWRPGLAFEASTHQIGGLRLSEMTGILLHFKFFSDFHGNAWREVVRGEHWDSAAQYVSYRDGLDAAPELSAHYEGSTKYSNSGQLVALGLMKYPRDMERILTAAKGDDRAE